MTVVAPGMRTASSPGSRAALATAAAVAVGRPQLWLLGALGFAARGGFVILAIPVVTVPSPVVISILFRGQLGSTGSGSDALLLAATVLAAVAVVGGLFLAAYADVAAFERLVDDDGTEALREGMRVHPISGIQRVDLAISLASAQAAALLPAGLLAVLAADRINGAFVSELTSPSSFTSPLLVRVLAAASEPLAALAVALLLADVLYALSSRAILVRALDLDGSARPAPSATAAAIRGALRLLTRTGRSLATAALSWAITLVVVGPVLWASAVAWDGARSILLSPGSVTDPGAWQGGLVATIIFAAVWVAGTVLVGFASALRAALWSVDALR